MNFFQKLTGSLKMPQDDELFPEGSPAGREEKESSDQPHQQVQGSDEAPNLVPQAPAFLDKISEKPEIKSTSFKEMFAQQTDTQSTDAGDDEENYGGTKKTSEEQTPDSEQPIESEDENTGTFVTAQLAKAKTHTETRKMPVMSALKKTLPHIRLRGNEKTEEPEINAPEGQLAIDVYETPEEVVIKSTIAGVKSEDLDVGVEENTINIRGSRHNEEKVKGEDYFYQECYWGTFSRSVILPVEVDADKTQASLKDGILTIRLPKIVREKEKKIKILS